MLLPKRRLFIIDYDTIKVLINFVLLISSLLQEPSNKEFQLRYFSEQPWRPSVRRRQNRRVSPHHLRWEVCCDLWRHGACIGARADAWGRARSRAERTPAVVQWGCFRELLIPRINRSPTHRCITVTFVNQNNLFCLKLQSSRIKLVWKLLTSITNHIWSSSDDIPRFKNRPKNSGIFGCVDKSRKTRNSSSISSMFSVMFSRI